MDCRGGCCIARTSYAGDVYDMSKVDRIMLRFRPIAPKPASSTSNTAGGSSSGGSSPEISEVSPKSGRGKRRCNSGSGTASKRCNSGSNNRRRKVVSEEKGGETVITLPLLPEAPDRKPSPSRESPVKFVTAENKAVKNTPRWLSFGGNVEDRDHHVVIPSDRTVLVPQMTKVVGSCVTVECIIDTWEDAEALGCSEEERKANLGEDTCPGLISDCYGRVTWTNDAFRKMVVSQQGGENGADAEVAVWLVMKEKIPVTMALEPRAFTCRVRVQNHGTCGSGRERLSSITVPGDAWRLNGGGFAWRLDVKTALCLGR